MHRLWHLSLESVCVLQKQAEKIAREEQDRRDAKEEAQAGKVLQQIQGRAHPETIVEEEEGQQETVHDTTNEDDKTSDDASPDSSMKGNRPEVQYQLPDIHRESTGSHASVRLSYYGTAHCIYPCRFHQSSQHKWHQDFTGRHIPAIWLSEEWSPLKFAISNSSSPSCWQAGWNMSCLASALPTWLGIKMTAEQYLWSWQLNFFGSIEPPFNDFLGAGRHHSQRVWSLSNQKRCHPAPRDHIL